MAHHGIDTLRTQFVIHKICSLCLLLRKQDERGEKVHLTAGDRHQHVEVSSFIRGDST